MAHQSLTMARMIVSKLRTKFQATIDVDDFIRFLMSLILS